MVALHGSQMHTKFCSNSSYSSFTEAHVPIVRFAERHNLVLPGDYKRIEWCRYCDIHFLSNSEILTILSRPPFKKQ